MGKNLKAFLVENTTPSSTLLVSDSKLASSIAKKLGLTVISDAAVHELTRGIREQLADLLQGLNQEDLNQMVLGLSHSLSRYKLKFSPDKVDTMVIQAINLLDDLDKVCVVSCFILFVEKLFSF